MKRFHTRIGIALAAMTLGTPALLAMGGTAHALSNPPTPQLTYTTQIPSHPWPTGPVAGVNANDVEGLVSVPVDNSIWVADDNRDRIYEINATTGGLKSQILKSTFQTNATQVGTGQLCSDPAQIDGSLVLTDPITHAPVPDTAASECLSRTDDFESLVYDPTADVLYLTSGGCCTAGLPTGYPKHPTVWELTRSGNTFVPSRWQALPETEDPTAAGWRPGTGSGSGFYYGKNNFIRTYDFATNGLGSKITTPTYLVGVDFVDASTVFLTTATPNPSTGRTTATSDSTITKYTFDGSSFTAVPGWTFPLKNTGMIDARDMALVGDTFYVSDGYDFRDGTEFNSSGISGDHLIYVYSLNGATLPVPAFTAVQQPAPALYTVQFTDGTEPAGVLTTPPTSWAWDFDGNGTTDDIAQSPLHVFNAPGTYPVKLTVTNAAGAMSVTKQVVVTGPKWRFETLNAASRFSGGNALLPYGAQLQAFYADNTNSSLTHSWWDGARWNVENLDGAGKNTNDSVGRYVTAVQFGAQIQLLYSDATTHTLRHAWWDGIRWNFETLDGAGGANGRTANFVGGGTIAFRQVGAQVQAFYSDDTAHKLRHAWWDGTRWNFENLAGASNLPSSATYVASTQSGSTLHVLNKTSAGDLERSWYDGSWHTQTVDGAGGSGGRTSHTVGDYVSLIPSATGMDAFYRDTNDASLRHATLNGSSWTFEILDGSGGSITGNTTNAVGTQIAAIRFGSSLHVVYQDTTTGAQRHAWFDTNGWHVEVLDGVGTLQPGASTSTNTGRSNALMVYSGQLHISYFDSANGARFRHSWFG